MAVRTPAPINQLFNYESIAVQLIFWMSIRGISHGFNGTQDCLVMARNFKDISCYFIYIYIYFRNNVIEIVHKMYTFHIHIRGPDCIQAFRAWMLSTFLQG